MELKTNFSKKPAKKILSLHGGKIEFEFCYINFKFNFQKFAFSSRFGSLNVWQGKNIWTWRHVGRFPWASSPLCLWAHRKKNYSLFLARHWHLLFLYDWAIFQPQFYELEINDVISGLVKNKKRLIANCVWNETPESFWCHLWGQETETLGKETPLKCFDKRRWRCF